MKLLLHLCCAHCGIAALEKLESRFQISLFWYNPNIYPEKEEQRRKKDALKLAKIYKKNWAEIKGKEVFWRQKMQGYETEPEGGKRCWLCFQERLEKTVQEAKKNKFDYWSTSLTTGPQKSAKKINDLGRALAQKYDLPFWEDDYKKQDGFKKSVILGKKYNFYRQNYCGCIFSQKS
jgi:predicted adenine nucleotide alpha hydrolase (AANH) superfamily ATPase